MITLGPKPGPASPGLGKQRELRKHMVGGVDLSRILGFAWFPESPDAGSSSGEQP